MAWLSPFQRPPSRADLSRRLKKLDRVFSIEKIRAEGLGADEVIAYYEECSPAYRKHHSREGAMHLAISPGSRFRAQGFYGQLDRISAAWPAQPPHDGARARLRPGLQPGLSRAAVSRGSLQRHRPDADPSRPRPQRLDRLGLKNVVLAKATFTPCPTPTASFDHVYASRRSAMRATCGKALSEVAARAAPRRHVPPVRRLLGAPARDLLRRGGARCGAGRQGRGDRDAFSWSTTSSTGAPSASRAARSSRSIPRSRPTCASSNG